MSFPVPQRSQKFRKNLSVRVKHINAMIMTIRQFSKFYKPFESRQTYPVLKYCQQMSLRSENKDLQKSEKLLTEAIR